MPFITFSRGVAVAMSGAAPWVMTLVAAPENAVPENAVPENAVKEPVPVIGYASTVRLIPPLDTPYTLQIMSQQRTRNGKFITFSVSYAVRFTKVADRILVDAVLTDALCDGPPAVAAAFVSTFDKVKGRPMRAIVAPETGMLTGTDLPDIDVRAVLAHLGASALYKDIISPTAGVQPTNSLWLEDVQSILQFANVDMARMQMANSDGATARVTMAKTIDTGWVLHTESGNNTDIQTVSEYHIARETGMVQQSTTAVRRRNVTGDDGIISRKTITFSAPATLTH